MKKRLLAVAAAALIGAVPVAQAQWVVIDPTNLRFPDPLILPTGTFSVRYTSE